MNRMEDPKSQKGRIYNYRVHWRNDTMISKWVKEWCKRVATPSDDSRVER